MISVLDQKSTRATVTGRKIKLKRNKLLVRVALFTLIVFCSGCIVFTIKSKPNDQSVCFYNSDYCTLKKFHLLRQNVLKTLKAVVTAST